MTRPAIAACLLLGLAGCHPADRSIVVRTRADHRDLLYSEVRIVGGMAVFHCVASASGVCHYAIYPHGCPGAEECDARPIQRFGVPAGRSLFDTTQPRGFVPCVATQAGDDAACTAGSNSA
jgi:hypothetical protein